MSRTSYFGKPARLAVAITVAILLAFSSVAFASASSNAGVALTQISHDPYTNTTSQHKTQVEPDTYSHGSTIVSTFQTGRFFDGGSSNIGWATTTNGGTSWTHGFLPGTTVYATPAGTYDRISDPAVSYDVKHNTWVISSLAITGTTGVAVLVSQSTNGGTTWTNPVVVASTSNGFFDKEWVDCDTNTSGSFAGHCYVEWDNAASGNTIMMSTSTDGGSHWGSAIHPSGANGLGGQPIAQPNGTVVVPYESLSGTIAAFTSTDGGTTWGHNNNIATIDVFFEPANIRTSPLPSAEVDGSGKIFVVWQDCRFESGCSANDIVVSTSTNGTTWSAVMRIPTDAVGSGVDHFIPGIAVDKTTSGNTAHLGLAYYFFTVASCTTNCVLGVGFVSSTNGGSTWTAPKVLKTGMSLNWLASTNQGQMVGDYMSTSITNGKAYPVFATASAPVGSSLREAMHTVTSGLSILGGSNPTTNVVLFRGHAAPSFPHTAF
jgi:BNR repeat-like domain